MTRLAPAYHLLAAAALVGGLATSASAQAPTVPPSVELGTRIGALGTLLGPIPGYGGSVTWHLNRVIALEGDVTLLPPVDLAFWEGRATMYQVGLRGRIVRAGPGVDWFWTGGVSGGMFESLLKTDRLPWLGPWLADTPNRTDRLLLAPLLPTVGTGIVVPIGAHLAIRGDIRALLTPAGPAAQTSVGVAIPLGRFGSR